MSHKFNTFIDIFGTLGNHLGDRFGSDALSTRAIDSAISSNGWFTREEIITAIEAIRTQMLNTAKLRAWLAPYNLEYPNQRRVGIIMAGNIAAIGFFDLLCTVVCGHTAVVKCSSKDKPLMEYLIEQLREINPNISIQSYDHDSKIDAIIATGSDNTNRYFRTQYANIPSLLRGSRHSVAVLDNTHSDLQLIGLAKDLFLYSGLGCRNVSHLFLPKEFDVALLAQQLSNYQGINPKYKNNYLQNKALLEMTGKEYIDGQFFIMRERADSSLYISELSYSTYSSLDEVKQWLQKHDSQLQCVVSNCLSHPRRVSFGQSQSPQLTDYPDAIDVIDFLKKI